MISKCKTKNVENVLVYEQKITFLIPDNIKNNAKSNETSQLKLPTKIREKRSG